MVNELVPLVAGQLGVDQIQTQHGHFHPSTLQPVEPQQLKGSQWWLERVVRQQWTQLPVRKPSRAWCRAQQLVAPTTKRAGLSTLSSGIAQRSPLGSLAMQLGS